MTRARRAARIVVRFLGLSSAAASYRRRTPSMRKSRQCRLSFYRQFVSPDDLCFDIGANEGNRVEVFAALGARVIAVEPQPRCVAVLRRFEKSGVTIIPKGAAASPGVLQLWESTAHTLATMSQEFMRETTYAGRFEEHRWMNGYEVEVTTLDLLIEQFGEPRFIKIDVEGFEYEVLRGLSRPVESMSFEYTAELLELTKLCVEHIVSLGEYVFSYSADETMKLGAPWCGGDEIIQELSRLDVGKAWGDVYAVRVDPPDRNDKIRPNSTSRASDAL